MVTDLTLIPEIPERLINLTVAAHINQPDTQRVKPGNVHMTVSDGPDRFKQLQWDMTTGPFEEWECFHRLG